MVQYLTGAVKKRKGEESGTYGILRNSTAQKTIETKIFIRYNI